MNNNERSGLDRNGLSPSDASGDQTLGSASLGLAANLFDHLKSEECNVAFSPLCISVALGMTLAGARGATKAEIASVLGVSESDDLVHNRFAEVLRQFKSAKTDATEAPLTASFSRPPKTGLFRLMSASGLWTRSGLEILEPFRALLTENYEAAIASLDFSAAPETSRIAINSWISDHTGGLIRDLARPGTIDIFTTLVLANAVYFRATWRSPFLLEDTHPGTFHRADGIDATVPMMETVGRYRYAEDTTWQLLELPYVGGYSMIVLLPRPTYAGRRTPDRGTTSPLQNGGSDPLTRLASYLRSQATGRLAALKSETVKLTMPRFQCSHRLSLKDPLKGMGMVKSFKPEEADFSAIAAGPPLFISDILHMAAVFVDEEQTEASAALFSNMLVGSARVGPPPRIIRVNLDRPFGFLIREDRTGTVCFAGRVMDPSPPA